jgi:hypothetical protein
MEAEVRIMCDLQLTYPDNSQSGGCIGELLTEVMSKLLENLQKRSRDKQCLHLTKSRPGKDLNKNGRRNIGDYFIVRSDKNHKIIGWDNYNVSEKEIPKK